MTLSFINGNNHATRTLVNGASYGSSLRDYSHDYDKFQVVLGAGGNLSVHASVSSGHIALELYNSLGIYQTAISSGSPTLVFQSPIGDTYYLILDNNDGAAHAVTTTPTIF